MFKYASFTNPVDKYSASHIGIVEKVEGGIVYTVEGNTGGGGIYNTQVNKKSFNIYNYNTAMPSAEAVLRWDGRWYPSHAGTYNH